MIMLCMMNYISIAKELKCASFNDIEVFGTYMKRRNTDSIDYGKDIKIKDLKFGNMESI